LNPLAPLGSRAGLISVERSERAIPLSLKGMSGFGNNCPCAAQSKRMAFDATTKDAVQPEGQDFF
jgi:hypothetical protein